MTADQVDIAEVLSLLDETTSGFVKLVSSFSEKNINASPGHGKWTAAQVADHVTKSNVNITHELTKAGKPCDREPDAGVEKIKSIFLNFSKKLSSPEFILPGQDNYERDKLISNLQTSVDELVLAARKTDPFEMINHAIFGEITRLETIYFVVFHTQRHIHQLENILDALEAGGK